MSVRVADRLWATDHLRAALGLLAAIVLLYSPVVLLSRTLQAPLYYPQGVVDQGAYGYAGRKPVNTFNIDLGTPAYYEWPIDVLVGQAYRHGEVPLWNPYQAAGTPLAAQYSTRAFFPYQVLLDLAPVTTWDFFFLGRLWIAGVFTYLFLRALGTSWPGGMVGGICYMFSGTFVWFINLEQFVNTAMVAPVLLWSIAGLWRWRWQHGSVAVAIAVALVLLAGQPETALFVLILGASYAAFGLGVAEARRRAPILWGGVAGALLGVLLAGPQLATFLEFQRHSFNIHPTGGTMGVQDPARPLDALSILIPTLYQHDTFYRIFPDNGRWDWLGGYLGGIPVYLTVLGVMLVCLQQQSRWGHPLAFFSLFGLVVVLKNFGVPLVAWVGHLPLLDQAWSPRWAGPTWTLSFAIAGALGLECLRDARGAEQRPWVARWREHLWPRIGRSLRTVFGQPLFYFYAALCLVFVLIIGVPWALDAAARSEGIAGDILRGRYVFPSVALGLVVALLVLLAGAYLTRVHWRNEIPLSAFCGLALLELWFAIPWGYQPATAALRVFVVAAGLGAVVALARGQVPWAVAGAIVAAGFALGIDVTAPQGAPERYDASTPAPFVRFLQGQAGHYRVTGGNGVLVPNFASTVHLQDIRYINSLVEDSYQRFRDRHLHTHTLWPLQGSTLWFTGGAQLDWNKDGQPARAAVDFGEEFKANLPFYSLLGVKYIVTPKAYELSYANPGMNLLHNGDLAKWSQGGGPFRNKGEVWADGWDIDLFGRSRISVSRDSARVDGHMYATGRIVYSHDRPSYVRVPIADFRPYLGATITFSLRVRASAPEAVRVGISGDGTGTSWSTYHTGSNGWETLVTSHTIPTDGVKALVPLVELRKSASVEVADAWLFRGQGQVSRHTYYVSPELLRRAAEAGEPSPVNLLQNGGLETWSGGMGPFAYPPSTTTNRGELRWADHWVVESAEDAVLEIAADETDVDGNARYSARVSQAGRGHSVLAQHVDVPGEGAWPAAAFSFRVKTAAPQAIRIGIETDRLGVRWSAYHPGDGDWHMLTVVSPIPAGTESVRVLVDVRGRVLAHLDNAMLVPGAQAVQFIPNTFFRKVYDGEVKIYENRAAVPRAFVVHEIVTRPTREEAQEAVGGPAFDLQHVAVLEEPVQAWYRGAPGRTATAPPGPSRASITNYGLNEVTVEAESTAPGILVLTDVFAPGWTARVDGHPTDVFRVDGLVRGVRLGPGKHVVAFRYQPRSVELGFFLASGAVVGCGLLLAVPTHGGRRRSARR